MIIVAGANGSGKTTFAKPYVKDKGYLFLNADEIAKELTKQGEQNAMIKAGRIFFKNLHQWLEEGQSFVVETTLSGTYINKVAQKAQDVGYEVTVIYIFLENEDICVERVKNRVVKGGHDVPIEDIKRRYYRSKRNFWTNLVPLINTYFLLYNGDEGFQEVAIGREGSHVIINKILLDLYFKNYRDETS